MIIVFLSNQVPLHCGLSVQMRYTELLFLNKYHIKHVFLCVIYEKTFFCLHCKARFVIQQQ